MRSFYLELPRDEFAQRFPRERIPVSAAINTTQGLGRIATEFCATLATEGAKLEAGSRAHLGSQLMDMLAFTLLSAEGDMPAAEGSVRQARLQVGPAMDRGAHLRTPTFRWKGSPPPTACRCATCTCCSRQCEMSASEWIWDRRLQLCYDRIAKGDGRSITSIAFDHGFNSSAHFSTLFRRKYGLAPRDLSRTPHLSTSLSEGQA